MTLLISLPASVCIFHAHGLQTSNRAAAAAQHQRASFSVMCSHATTTTISRRSGNYEPPTWDYANIQSINTNNYTDDEGYVKRRDELKKKVQNMLNNQEMEELEKMELIDELQRLGLAYHFEDEITDALMRSKDAFDGFLEGSGGNFKTDICEDTKGLLNLYEASFLSMEGETTLDLARDFSTKHLKRAAAGNFRTVDPNLRVAVQRALEMPLHWRVPRLEASGNIHLYHAKPNHNPVLLELAKLDFNILQTLHQHELKSVSRWWKSSYIAERLNFVRDRVVENFFWTVGIFNYPGYSNARRIEAKLNCLLCTIDDIYDVYGTLDELQVFTDVIERWSDTTNIGHLPEYMKLSYFAVHNFVNEVAYDVCKEQGILVSGYLRKTWIDLCKAHLQEAKWFHSGYKPTYKEYIENSWISISGALIIVHSFVCVDNPLDEEALHRLSVHYHDIARFPSLVLRLANDKGTSHHEMKRGDTPKALECYMNSAGVSMNDAQENINLQIDEAWKKMNKIGFEDKPFSKRSIEVAMNVARVAQFMYQYGDGHGIKTCETQTRMQSILFEPIPLK
ncbi:unnamed protein product [Cuscuta europaea]|uniref:Uncharacterized protein n=1 Tax=Cuscuta europaea TaxID=41803 RepID=A0A9P1EIH1_CUSEU|nr:unnamed protein product [Cuscuta europaea]